MRALRRAYLAFAPEFDAVLANYARNAAPAALLDKYRELAAAGDEPSASDSTLLAVAEAGAKLGDAPLAIQVVGRILSEFPDSAHRPQALWTAALVQERAGRRDLMEKTLRRLVVEHGGHPLAHQAAQKLMIPR